MLYLMMVLNEQVEDLLVELEQVFVELNMMVEHKYLLLNYYKKLLVMFDHYMLDNNMNLIEVYMMNKDQHKNPMKMNRVMDMMVDNNMMLVKNNMNPY